MTRLLDELCDRIQRLSSRAERRHTWIRGMRVFVAGRTAHQLGEVTEPMLAVTAHGAKETMLGSRTFPYRAGQYLIATLDLPVTGRIVGADPFVGLALPLRAAVIAELANRHPGPLPLPTPEPAMAVGTADENLLDAIVRLLRLADHPRDFAVLAPAVEQEIHWRLLTGPQGDMVRQAGRQDGPGAVVGRAATWIREHFDEVIPMAQLATYAGVSVPTLNRHFRAVTAMSPLQYQKHLRLQTARARIVNRAGSVASVGHAVGYGSPSQFSREYRRMFGNSPAHDTPRS